MNEVDRWTAEEFDALVGAELFAYAPRGDARDSEIGDAIEMGNPARLVVLAVSVVALAASAKTAPFKPAQGRGGIEALDAAQRVFAQRGIQVETKDKDAGILATEWRASGDPPTGRWRWMISVDGGEFTVNRQCQQRLHDDWGGLKDWTPCEVQLEGRSKEAADLAAEIEAMIGGGEATDEPESARVDEPEQTEFCFKATGEASRCSITKEECEADRDQRGDPEATECAAR